jgi:predicted small secreted protein
MKSNYLGKTLTLAALAALTLATTAACNTVKGAGEDISSVGRAGERAIKKR